MEFLIENINVLDNCGVFNPEMYSLLSDWYGYILIAVPALVLILCTVDIAKAVIAQDDKQVKDAQSKAIKRVIIGVVIFFIPIILNLLLGWVTGVPLGDTCNIEEVN